MPSDPHPPAPAAAPASPVHWSALPGWLAVLLIATAAVLPRCLALNDFFTVDESFHWVWRVQHFAGAVRQHDWAGTNLTGHPGITTLWLGTAGRWLAGLLAIPTAGQAEGSAGIGYLAALRLPLALVNSLAVVAGYLLLRHLVRPSVALLAGLLWATSPFLVAHSRLLHLDGLLTSLLACSLLCLLLATSQPEPGRWRSLGPIIASGCLAGLALLTKAPSLLLPPLAGLVLLLATWPNANLWARLVWALPRYLLWLICAALIFVAGWPAVWVAPLDAVGAIFSEVLANGALPHHTGNYFLGQPVADPGWRFYPTVVLWRSTPALLIGLLLLPLALRSLRTAPPETPAGQRERTVLLVLVLAVLLFGAALSLAPKKFDRYLLPAWPALTVLAAAGLVWLTNLLARWLPALTRPGALLVAVAVLLANLAWYHPSMLAYFNPLLGGGTVAQRVLLVGWGEGMAEVGAWLRTRPDLTRSPVLAWDPRALEPFIPVRTRFLTTGNLAEPASYAVDYIRSAQRQESADAWATLRQQPPLYVLQMYGIDYAAVYQPPRPYAERLDIIFGAGLHLRGFSQQQQQGHLIITPSWNVQADQPGGRFCFLHLLDGDGQTVAQVDAPIDEGLFATWQAGQQFGSPLPLALPPALPAGRYRVVLGVYDPASGARLPVVQGTALPAAVDGPDVVQVMEFRQSATAE